MHTRIFLILLVTLLASTGCTTTNSSSSKRKLTFHASFDEKLDADFAAGDPVLYVAEGSTAKPGLPAEGVIHMKSGGKKGGFLRFTKKQKPVSFFRGLHNVPYNKTNWQGTVSFFLRLNPETDLEPGFTDPLQITPKDWNNAAFFVEFGKDEKPRHFRLGVYADFSVWNPQNKDWEGIPFSEKPLIGVELPPFSRSQWTHVAFTFTRFNTGKKDGVATLYLNGVRQGSLTPREQTFSWDEEKNKIMLALSYIGDFDELKIFNRVLSERDIQSLSR